MSGSPASLRALAEKCRGLACGGGMAHLAPALNEMALDYDRQADRAAEAEVLARDMLANRTAD
jgi:hypothetical protein